MLAIIETWAEDGKCHQENTMHYLFLLFFKVVLNALILASCFRSLRGSFMCVSGFSLCLVDVLLLCSITCMWLGKNVEASASIPMCFILSHASTVYSVLPLPVLLLGAMDHALHSCLGIQRWAGARLPACCALVLLTWVLAALYSYSHTNTMVVEVREDTVRLATLCVVQDSSVVIWFCMTLSVAVVCLLVVTYPGIVVWFRASNLPPISGPEQQKEPFQNDMGAESYLRWARRPAPPFLRSLAVAFALNWSPYLVINIVCILVDFAVPSYISINLLWLLCANSLMVATVVWIKGGRPSSDIELLDDTCIWSLRWYTEAGLGLQTVFLRGIYTVSRRDLDILLV